MMDNFEFIPYENVINSNYSFYNVSINGKSLFSEFENSLTQKSDISAFSSIIAMMNNFSPNLLRSKMFNHIKGKKKDRDDIYEFKKNNLRVYVILQKPNVFLLMGGFKSDQEKTDIPKVFRLYNNMNIPEL